MLVAREPDVKTVLKKNPNWWGIKAGRFEGNVDDMVYTPIVSDATRVAALISGEVDLVNDPPPQDVPRLAQTPNIKVLEGVENRIVFIGMDQNRDELLYSNVKGKNPFKDKRVREALYLAIDIDAIKQDDDARPVEALGRDCCPTRRCQHPGNREAAAVRPREGEEAPGRRRLRQGLRGDDGLSEQPLRQRREDLPGAGRDVGADRRSTSRSTRCRAPSISRSSRRRTPACTCSAGAARRSMRSSSCSRCCQTYNGKGDGDYNYGRYSNAKLDELTAQDQGRHERRRAARRSSARRCSRTTRRSTTCRCTGR